MFQLILIKVSYASIGYRCITLQDIMIQPLYQDRVGRLSHAQSWYCLKLG